MLKPLPLPVRRILGGMRLRQRAPEVAPVDYDEAVALAQARVQQLVRHIKEEMDADDIARFYGGDRAPLPLGVVPDE